MTEKQDFQVPADRRPVHARESGRTRSILSWIVGPLIACAAIVVLIVSFPLFSSISIISSPQPTPKKQVRPMPAKPGPEHAEQVLMASSDDPDPSISRLSRLLVQTPCNRPAAIQLVLELNTALRFAETISVGSRFLAKCDTEVAVGFPVAYALYQISDFKGALALLSQYEADAQSDVNIVTWLGFIQEKLQKHHDAASNFHRALFLYPDLVDVHVQQFTYAANAFKAAKQYCEAAQVYEMYFSLEPRRREIGWIKIAVAALKRDGKCLDVTFVGQKSLAFDPVGQILADKVMVNGFAGPASLDPDAQSVRLSRDFATKAAVKLDPSNRVRIRIGAEAKVFYLSRVDLDVAGIKAKDVLVSVPEDDVGDRAAPDIVLGRSFLTQFDWRIEGRSLLLNVANK